MADKSGRGTYAITVDPYEFKNLLGLLGSFPAEYQQLVRDRAQPMSQRLAGQLMMSGLSAPAPQTKLVVQTIVLFASTSVALRRSVVLMAEKLLRAVKARRFVVKLRQRARCSGEQSTDRMAASTQSAEHLLTDLRLLTISAATGSLQRSTSMSQS